MQHKVLLNIFGPSTAGKSTVAELLQQHIERLYTVDFDVIKRQLSGYYWKRDSAVAQVLTFDTLVSAAKAELSILTLLPPPKTKEPYDRLAAIADTYGYTLLNVEVTAPAAVLIKRYEERMRNVEASGSTWKFKTPEEFKTTLQAGYFRPANTHTFDSSTMSPHDIFAGIQTLRGATVTSKPE